jgi:hypothetical protein
LGERIQRFEILLTLNSTDRDELIVDFKTIIDVIKYPKGYVIINKENGMCGDKKRNIEDINDSFNVDFDFSDNYDNVSECGGFPFFSSGVSSSDNSDSTSLEECRSEKLIWSYNETEKSILIVHENSFINCCGKHKIEVSKFEYKSSADIFINELDDPLDNQRCFFLFLFLFSFLFHFQIFFFVLFFIFLFFFL